MQQIYSNLKQGMAYARECLRKYGEVITSPSWQGIKREVKMFEVDSVYFRACMPQGKIALQEMVQPDLPWAEDHFWERVAGEPMNPGVQYRNWPGYKDKGFNDKNFKPQGEFSHTYMERYWPKYAGKFNSDEELKLVGKGMAPVPEEFDPNKGIRYAYGDLQDVIDLLIKEPFTRQAYLPVWFPEDTGVLHGGRVPCTIGYHFRRNGHDLHVHYMIRACDAIRHFRNDVYLTVRLAQWVLENLQEHDQWQDCQLGILTMDIIQFHVFEQERNLV